MSSVFLVVNNSVRTMADVESCQFGMQMQARSIIGRIYLLYQEFSGDDWMIKYSNLVTIQYSMT